MFAARAQNRKKNFEHNRELIFSAAVLLHTHTHTHIINMDLLAPKGTNQLGQLSEMCTFNKPLHPYLLQQCNKAKISLYPLQNLFFSIKLKVSVFLYIRSSLQVPSSHLQIP